MPIALVQILGAVAQAAASAIPSWEEASLIGTPDLLFQMVGAGSAARFVMVLLCFSVAANTAPTIYSCGLSAQVAIPFLVRGELLERPHAVSPTDNSPTISPSFCGIGRILANSHRGRKSLLFGSGQLPVHSCVLDGNLHPAHHHRAARLPSAGFAQDIPPRCVGRRQEASDRMGGYRFIDRRGTAHRRRHVTALVERLDRAEHPRWSVSRSPSSIHALIV